MVARDRGQLLLLGGLAMAIVFLAVIPLSNSLVVSESAASSETVREIERTADRQATIERAIRTLANRTDAVNNTDAFNATLRNYSLYRTHVSGQQSGVYVNASVNVTASGKGASNSSFTEPVSDDNDWSLTNGAEQISEFNITVEDSGPGQFGPRSSPSATSHFRVNVSNASGDRWRLRLVKVGSPPNDIAVDVMPPGGTWTNGVCSGQDYTIDVQSGTCTKGGATIGTFQSYTDTLTAPYDIRYENGHRVYDSYWNLTATGDFNDNLDKSIGVPYVDIVYNGPDTSYTRTIEVDEAP
ncbi:hypothetical protein [Haloarcula onubensis]|uniref:Uncharacterized protein n=1 Tax=Haloarcula onubensis TaxID=2950539 RepID=A0ABU2FRS1_9EURY|nr:hypothetical protein [Halomicroarcula sp. S3CR25-11]MDS0282977.1 hypothetical protein [Halomicroarcula sp. S3CR25-11]